MYIVIRGVYLTKFIYINKFIIKFEEVNCYLR